jgi:hypothetical protein
VTVLFGYLLTFAAGVGVGAALHARALNRAAEAQVEDLHLKVEVLHKSDELVDHLLAEKDELADRLDATGRVVADRDRLVTWLVGVVHDQAARLRRAPTFGSPHAGGRL